MLVAVFGPVAFISGLTGEFYRQFALTIAISTVISAFNSLTLSPALAAILLKPRGSRRDPLTWLLDHALGWFFKLFTVVFSASVTGFTNAGVTLAGTSGATTAVVTGSGTTYNVAVSGMTQSGTVIASVPAGVASANGLSNTASTIRSE